MKSLFTQFKYGRIIFFAEVIMLFLAVGVYFTSLSGTINNVVLRSQSENQITKLNSQVSELESQYVAEKNGVTLDLALSLGFKATAQISFVDGKSVAREFSLRTQ